VRFLRKVCALPEYDTLKVELRSYDEGAYYCEVCSSDIISAEYDFMKGVCENWQWNGEVTESRMVSYWHGLEAGEPSISTKYYTEEDNMPLPWGMHEEW